MECWSDGIMVKYELKKEVWSQAFNFYTLPDRCPIGCHSGLDPESSFFLDSYFRRNDFFITDRCIAESSSTLSTDRKDFKELHRQILEERSDTAHGA